MAPRSIWNGTIVFGLVTVPVKVFSATESKSIHFHQVHLKDGARIEHRRVCPKEDKEVDKDEIVMGYELSNGVLRRALQGRDLGRRGRALEADRRRALRRGRARSTRRSTTRPTTWARATTATTPTACCARRSRQSGKVAIARWTFHDRERLVAVRPLGKILSLQTMNFHDEVVGVDDLDLPSPQRNPSDSEIEMAGKLVKSLAAKFKPEDYEDSYREAVLAVIERKAKGEEIVEEPEETKQQDSDDLMAALEASL